MTTQKTKILTLLQTLFSLHLSTVPNVEEEVIRKKGWLLIAIFSIEISSNMDLR